MTISSVLPPVEDRLGISLLPPEILLEILSYLTTQYNLIYVCKAWYSAHIEHLWFRPNIPNQDILWSFTSVLCQHNLTLDYTLIIKRLNLSGVANILTDDILLKMSHCCSLERFTLTNANRITDQSLVPLLHNNTNLLSIDISGMPFITDLTVESIANNCAFLQGLYATGLEAVHDQSMVALAQNCPNMKRIKVNNCVLLTDAAVRAFVDSCPLIVELDISGCTNISPETGSYCLELLSQLREFRLAMLPNVNDTTFQRLPNTLNFERLRVLDLSGCTMISDSSVHKIVTVAPKLKNIVLAKCFDITDASLAHLATLGKNLQYVHLAHCMHITNRGVATLVEGCPRIQYLDFACCGQLTDISVFHISSLSRLKRVGLVKCPNITDYGILALAQRSLDDPSYRIERVHLSYCANLTLQSISPLVKAATSLTHLSLTGVQAFMRQDLMQFCRPPPVEFTGAQRQSFCVFSGDGIKRLRHYLLNTIGADPMYTHTFVEQIAHFFRENVEDVLAAATNMVRLTDEEEQPDANEFRMTLNRLLLNEDGIAVPADGIRRNNTDVEGNIHITVNNNNQIMSITDGDGVPITNINHRAILDAFSHNIANSEAINRAFNIEFGPGTTMNRGVQGRNLRNANPFNNGLRNPNNVNPVRNINQTNDFNNGNFARPVNNGNFAQDVNNAVPVHPINNGIPAQNILEANQANNFNDFNDFNTVNNAHYINNMNLQMAGNMNMQTANNVNTNMNVRTNPIGMNNMNNMNMNMDFNNMTVNNINTNNNDTRDNSRNPNNINTTDTTNNTANNNNQGGRFGRGGAWPTFRNWLN